MKHLYSITTVARGTTPGKYFLAGLLFISALSHAQVASEKTGKGPLCIIDSVTMNTRGVPDINPETITLLTIVDAKEAVAILGDEGKQGAIYVETINFVKSRYCKYFRSKLSNNHKALKKINECEDVLFILNGASLHDKDLGRLYRVNDKTLTDFKLIGKKVLRKKYKIKERTVGIEITAHLE